MGGAMTLMVGRSPVAPSGGNATVRATRKQYVNNASSAVFTFPTGSAAGDLCVIFAGHGYGTTTPAGWTELDNRQGSNFNGACFYKFLTSGDISTGSVTISFAGTYYGHVAGVTMTGGSYPVRAYGGGRNSAGASTRTISTAQTWPVSGDLALYFGAARVNASCSTATGTSLQTDAQANSSMALSDELLSSGGTASETFNFGGSPSGDYEAIVIVRGAAVTAGSTATRWRLNCTTNGGYGVDAIAEVELRATVGGGDQTSQGLYRGSSQYSGSYTYDKAFDDSSATMWQSNSASGEYLEYESFYPIDVAQIAITASNVFPTGAPVTFNLQYWNSSSWTTAQSWSTPSTWTAGETRTFNV